MKNLSMFSVLAASAVSVCASANMPEADLWPVRFTANGKQFQVFTPQPETLDGVHFTARAAVALLREQDKEPIFGAIRGDGVLEMDRSSRLASLRTFTVTDAKFPGITDPAEIDELKSVLSTGIAANAGPISLDWLESALEQDKPAGEAAYNNDPPKIIYRDHASALVFIDGQPQYERMKETIADQGDPVYTSTKGTAIDRVVNTPFLLVRPEGGDHYLFGSGLWFRAKDINGPWQRTDDVPGELKAIAAKADSSAALTGNDTPGAVVPEIVVSTEPAELVDTDGPPQLEPIQNTDLLYVTNTDKNLFMDISGQQYYLLASGRWFSTKDLKNGPWSYADANALPATFRDIPEGSSKSDVLAHVSGTEAAREAALDASIPQTAKVDRRNATVTVTYDGDPAFEHIQGTSVDYARNASTTVLRINGRYFVCDNAVWFQGDSPDGPWAVSDQVPTEVNTIPPSSPVYNTRYVYIYDRTPDYIYYGYTPGYLGCYVQNGVVIYGTGYYYDYWPHHWRPRPFTYGFNMWYDPWAGWGFGWGWGWNWFYPHWGWHGYHPYGWGWWGPQHYHPYCWNNYYGYRDHHTVVYGHRPGMNGERGGRSALDAPAAKPLRPANLYAQGGRPGVRPSMVSRPASPAARPSTKENATTVRPMKPINRDHFTDAAGNVFRYDGGRTEKYNSGSWNRVPPRPVPPQTRPGNAVEQRPGGNVERPAGARPTQQPDIYHIQQDRARGDRRARDFQNYQQQRAVPPRVAPQRTAPPPRSKPSAPRGGSLNMGGGGGRMSGGGGSRGGTGGGGSHGSGGSRGGRK